MLSDVIEVDVREDPSEPRLVEQLSKMIAALGDEPGERLSQQALIERHRVTGGGDVVMGALEKSSKRSSSAISPSTSPKT